MEGALIGGGLTLLAGALAVLQVEADPTLQTKENAGVIILGLTAGGTVIGGLIGFAMPKEKTVFQKGRLLAQISLFPNSIKGKNKNISAPIIALDILF